MTSTFVEATDSTRFNWGKFCVYRFDQDEWSRRSSFVGESGLLQGRGWTPKHIGVLDLQTGEGAIFRPGGLASADLAKHAIWVCPLFEPFLTWLYTQDLSDIQAIPALVDLGPVPTSLAGYRRKGPDLAEKVRLELTERWKRSGAPAGKSYSDLIADVVKAIRRNHKN